MDPFDRQENLDQYDQLHSHVVCLTESVWKSLADSSAVQASWVEQPGRGPSFSHTGAAEVRGRPATPLFSLPFSSQPGGSPTHTSASFSPQGQEECQECKCLPRCWPQQVSRGHCSRPASFRRLRPRRQVEEGINTPLL